VHQYPSAFPCLNFRPPENQIPKTENSDFVFLPRTQQLGLPNMEGLIPIAMAVAWMTLLASSTSSSLVVSLFKLLKDPHSLPLLFQGHPPFLDVLFSYRNTTSHSGQSRPQLTQSFITLRSQYPILSHPLFPPTRPSLCGQSRSQLTKSSRPLSLPSSVDVPRCPSIVKPWPWAWQSTLPSSNYTTS
jgi:hypothetical protein